MAASFSGDFDGQSQFTVIEIKAFAVSVLGSW